MDRHKGYIEGLPWEIEREGTGWKIEIGEPYGNALSYSGTVTLHVSTPDGYAGLFRLIEALKDITRPILSEEV